MNINRDRNYEIFISKTVIRQADGKQFLGKATTFTCNPILDES